MNKPTRNLITVSLDIIEGYINYIKELERELLSTNAYYRCHGCDKVFNEDLIEHGPGDEMYCAVCMPKAEQDLQDLIESDEQDYQTAKRGR